MIPLIIISLALLVSLNIFFLKYKLLKLKIDFISSIDLEELSDMLMEDVKPNYDHAMDLRGTPTHICPCGSKVWNLKATFDNFEIGSYLLDMECVNCGSLATAPTPIDKG